MTLCNIFKNFIDKQPKDKAKNSSTVRCFDNYVGQIKIVNGAVASKALWFCRDLRISNHYCVSEKIDLSNYQSPLEKMCNCKTIVLILESPHKDEYDDSKSSITPAPALGRTGSNLDNKFVCKINEFIKNNTKRVEIKNGVYNIILMNAVQYQCSMGLVPLNTTVRNALFLQMWFNGKVRKNFTKRLNKYAPDVVINCCTNGSVNGHNINKSFLKKINREIKISNNKEVLLNDQKMTHGFQSSKLNYKLSEFVQYEIDAHIDNKPKTLLLTCGHPSSWNRSVVTIRGL